MNARRALILVFVLAVAAIGVHGPTRSRILALFQGRESGSVMVRMLSVSSDPTGVSHASVVATNLSERTLKTVVLSCHALTAQGGTIQTVAVDLTRAAPLAVKEHRTFEVAFDLPPSTVVHDVACVATSAE